MPSIIKALFAFYFIIAMNLALLSPGGGSLYQLFNINTWIFISIFISIGLWASSNDRLITYSKPLVVILLGVLLLFVPMAFENSSIYLFFPRFASLIGAMLLLFSLYQFKITAKDKLHILLLCLIGIGIQATIGLLQIYLFNFIESSGYLGAYDFVGDRPSGIFRQPNVMASLMATGIVLAIFLISQNIFSKVFSPKLTSVIYYCLFTCSVVLIPLQSKTGYLGFILAFILTIPIIFRNFKSFKMPLITLICGIFIGVITLNFIQDLNRGEKLLSDGGVRSEIYLVSSKIIQDNPLTGVGYGQFERSYREYFLQESAVNESLKNPIPNLTHPHNEIFYWIVEGGLFAVLAFLMFFVASFLMLKRINKVEYLAKVSLIIPILLHTQTEYPFYQSIPHLFIFLLIFWFIDTETKDVYTKNLQGNKLSKIGSFLIPACVIPFMITSIHTMYMVSNYYFSAPKNYNYIESIINKISWDEYIDKLNYERYLQYGLSTNNVEVLNNYLDWASNLAKTQPRAFMFNNMIFVIKHIEEIDGQVDSSLKNSIIRDAADLYPEIKKIGSYPIKYITL